MKTRKESKAQQYGTATEVEVVPTIGVGLLPDEVYDRALSSWRAGIRRQLTKSLAWESRVIGAMQVSIN